MKGFGKVLGYFVPIPSIPFVLRFNNVNFLIFVSENSEVCRLTVLAQITTFLLIPNSVLIVCPNLYVVFPFLDFQRSFFIMFLFGKTSKL